MAISVRPATLEDAGAIAAVNLASWEATYRGIVADAFLDRVTLAGRMTAWHERIAAAAHPILVAEAEGQVRGYCSLVLPSRDQDASPQTAEIGAIYVAPSGFRGGVGTAMVHAALALMRDRGFGEVTLWVLSANVHARAFYAGRGFSADGLLKWDEVLGAEEMRLWRSL